MPASAAVLNQLSKPHYQVIWEPQRGPQRLAMKCRFVDELFYGGARGGGKTDFAVGDWADHAAEFGAFAKGILFRKSYDELEEVVERTSQLYPKLGAHYNISKRMWVFPNGAKLWLRYLKRDKDAEKYQGRSFTWMCIEEITNFPSPAPIDKLKGTLRSAHGVRCRWIATGNPGGPGHNWVKGRFISPMRPYEIFTDPRTNRTRIFIPSKLEDNKLLMRSDPTYVDRLRDAGPAWLVQAWLSGNWDIVAGGMFDDVWDRDKLVLPSVEIPKHWPIYRSFDWGSTKPFSVGYHARLPGDESFLGRIFKKNTRIRVFEWYGCKKDEPNTGLKMLATEIAEQGLQQERLWGIASQIRTGPADPSIFTEENGSCIAKDMAQKKMIFLPADTRPGSRKTGWETYRKMLKAGLKTPYEEPGYFVMDRCLDYIRTVPVLPRDERMPDDVDSNSEDHIGDESRYDITWNPPVSSQSKTSGY